VVVRHLPYQSKLSKLLYCKTVVNSSITELSSCSLVRFLRRPREKYVSPLLSYNAYKKGK